MAMKNNFIYENKENDLIEFLQKFAIENNVIIKNIPNWYKIPSIVLEKTRFSISQNQRLYDGRYVMTNSFKIEQGNKIIRDNIKFDSIFIIFQQCYEQYLIEQSIQ